jgi:hypothetical protein
MTNGRSVTEVPILHEVDPGHVVACHLTVAQRDKLRAERIKVPAAEATGIVGVSTGEDA